ncbi:hypothetical protein FNF31_01958 [Cafeteria roenbergensis]|uniref:NADP-dependent oxidoreductase domain-containing protein n=2 Tax=Cafeteria roenbergensis TaxID=33653 RepID=A0A5A8DVI0_CAFRO|nr:hypothetical protein FNF31_01958 [Cafeteria roenbergensis]KAA0169485.1 hypothetical protein FNF28_02097 [Cafeteria roenbergensis]
MGELFRPMPEKEAAELVRVAHEDLGVTLFDTAPFYGFGASELRLGAGLRGCGIGVGDGTTSFGRERVQISTKVGRVLRPGAKERFMFAGGAEFHETFDYTGAGIDASLEQSRCRLGMSKADFLVIHDLEPERHGDDGGVDRRLDELAGAGAGWSRLEALREQGQVGAVGAGLNRLDMAQRFWDRGIDVDFFLVAGRLTLLENGADEEGVGPAVRAFLEECERRGTALLVGGVFNSGILATGADDPASKFDYAAAPDRVRARVRKLEAVCQAHGAELRTAALQYPHYAHGQAQDPREAGSAAEAQPARGSGTVAAIIPGADDVASLRANAASLAEPLPEALWEDLRGEGLVE